MARKKPITIEDLWQIERLGTPSLSPDGAQAVLAVTSHSMADNSAASALWLLSTLGGAPRQLTRCGDKDGQPQFSPRGDRIGFVARREQQGVKDATPQFYAIPVDGGEAQRIGSVATGIDAFRWCPDGEHIVFVSWVWPQLKGAKAQAQALKDKQANKATGVATSEGLYRYWDHMLPEGRVPHLHRMNLKSGRVQDLFEGTPYSLDWCEPDANCFDVSPDGRRVVFAFDPSPEHRIDSRFALAEIDIRSRRIEVVAQDIAWHYGAPKYSGDGTRIACLASHQALRHTMPNHLAVFTPGEPTEVLSAEWDHDVAAPLLWEEDGSAVLFGAEQQGRRHLWRFDLADRRAEVLVPGGTVQGFDKRAGTVVTVADAADHPARCHAYLPGVVPRRIETFNDQLLARIDLGTHEAIRITGAQGDPVQVWLFHPPGFDPKKRYPLLQVIHGGPHTAVGDGWHYRWNNPLLAAGSGETGKGKRRGKAEQGQVVAVVNYHGSSGFGHAFLDSITHRWGQLELQDVEAATAALLQRPYIDPQRVYAAGGSYGGYMVAWMNAHATPGRYAAYICHAGCYDWTAMFADDAWSWHAKELGAWYWDDIAKVQAQSPHAFAATMHTPTLVIHGALDYRVPDAQGLAYYNTLKARGVPARLLWYPDENHWILKPQNSRLWYREFFAWLQNQPATAAGTHMARPLA
jgi:dipeptidyl aminopeptidase/acylaminoacyl peptidase